MTRISVIQERYKETCWSAFRIPSILLILGKMCNVKKRGWDCEKGAFRRSLSHLKGHEHLLLWQRIYIRRNRTTCNFYNFIFQCLTLFYLFSFLFVEFTRTYPIYSHRAVNEPAWTVFTSNVAHGYCCYLILGAITRMHVTYGWPASYFTKLY